MRLERAGLGTARGAGARRPPLAPVARETIQDRVYAALRRSLANGMFDAGAILRIQDLAERFETSTMPVREALGRLVSERALEALPNRSVRVPLITRKRIDDLERARRLIEGTMTKRAVKRLAGDAVSELRRLTEACERAFRGGGGDKAHRTSELNQAFHFAIYRAADSPVLLPIVESLWLQSGPSIRLAAQIHDERRDGAATRHHHALIEAIAAKDKRAAVKALGDDISSSFDLIRRRLDEDETRLRNGAAHV